MKQGIFADRTDEEIEALVSRLEKRISFMSKLHARAVSTLKRRDKQKRRKSNAEAGAKNNT